jgi:serine/threonine protein kinase
VLPGTTPHDFEIKVVLSRTFAEEMAAGKRRNLEVVVEGTGPGGKSGKTTLTFTAMAMAMPPYRDPIPGTVQPEDMLQCPVGVESHYDALLTHVRQGASSFYVCGPRRFGKTSLLNAIEKLVGAGDVVVLKCVTASMRPLSSLWNEDIVKSFQERFGRRPDTELEDKLLPADYAYDSIREVAAARGIRAIYVLIDEAQAMFAHPRRAELAERLKERLEHAWMAVSEDGKVKRAAILFGFIGQGHLPRLLTPNFRASLKDYARFEFTDEEILGLLKRTTGADGLQSTKEAREHLARLAGNLFILNRLLKELHSLCTEGRRTWFLRADVDRASAKLEAAFRDGAGSDIWDWVRDPLNESDDRNDWQPSTTYPVALAWAGARARGTSGRAGALALLKQFCPRAEPLDERVSEALRELSDLRVLDPQGDFKLPMLERLLAIRAESPTPLSEAEQEAAQRLGLARVRRPPPERSDDDDPPEVQGGQARVWRAEWEGHVAAVRAISLSDKTHARTRFIHEVTLLRKIGKAGGQRVQLRLPRIFEMGIAEDDPSTGLVIYEWIPGYPLPEASMTEPAVAEVGLQMADVLDVLEQIGVVHRDIRPANVLLRVPTEGRDARVAIDVVLIDFGLARAVEHLRGGPRSIVEGVAVYIPPEVYGTGDAAAWSTAGDVYSTGVMLEKLLRPGSAADHAPSSRQLLALIGDMKARLPADRPTAAQLRTRLHDVVKSLEAEHKSTRLDQIEEAVRQRVVTLPEPVRTSAQDYVHTLVYLRAGMLRDERRYTAVSAFLENAFRRIIKAKVPRYALPTNVYLRSARDLLAAARLDTPAWFDERRTEAVGLLRNAEHHPDDFNGILDRALSQLGSSYSAPDRDARLFEALEHVARLLDEVTRSSQVAILVAEVLRTGAPGQTPRAP